VPPEPAPRRTSWWLLLAAAALVCSRAAYRGAVQAARAYGEAVAVAFDLHRLDLYAALHLPLPARAEDEPALGAEISLRWRQGRAPSGPLDHTSAHSQTDINPSQHTRQCLPPIRVGHPGPRHLADTARAWSGQPTKASAQVSHIR
jgi:hypothetical protein